MLPNDQGQPSGALDLTNGVRVSVLDGFELDFPPLPVRPWHGEVLRAAMPEAAVDENRDSRSTEEYVGSPSPRDARWSRVHQEAQPQGVQGTAQFDLWSRIAPSVANEHRAHRW